MKKSTEIVLSIFIFQIIILLLFNLQCKKRSDSKQLNEKLFVQIYCDVVIYADLVDAKRREALVDSVLKSYQMSREEFQGAVAVYSRNEKKWEKIFTKMVEELARREKELSARKDTVKVEEQ